MQSARWPSNRKFAGFCQFLVRVRVRFSAVHAINGVTDSLFEGLKRMNPATVIESEESIVKRLSRPNLAHWLVLVAIDWAMIIAILAVCYHFWNPVVVVLGAFLLGTRQHALAVLGHEGTHYRISETRRLNDLLSGVLCFGPLGFDGEVYRRFHLQHHLHTSTPNDPELELKAAAAPMYDQPTPFRRIVMSFVTGLVGAGIPELYRFVRKLPPRSWRELAGPIAWHTLALSSLVVTKQLWVAGIWWVAYCTSYWAVFRGRIWTEHHETDDTNRTHFNWVQQFFFVPNGIGYHYEHHRWPSITSWNVKIARHLLHPSIAVIPMARLLRFYADLPPLKSGSVRRQPLNNGS
jgi:fatty acid desaturase